MKQQKMIDELMYRIDRYRSMGNGAMAQAQKAFLFLCLIAKDWGTFSNHTRTCEHTHTALKHISPFTVRSQAST